LKQKLEYPLNNIIRNCEELENSEQLKKFEEKNGETLRHMIKNARLVSNLMYYHLRDMDDWTSLRSGHFKRVTTSFSLLDSLKEIYEMMDIKANFKGLRFEISTCWNLPENVIGDRCRIQ
jgi:hypothetical protein